MIEYEFSEHAYDMLRERNIREAWVQLSMGNPDRLKKQTMMAPLTILEQLRSMKGDIYALS